VTDRPPDVEVSVSLKAGELTLHAPLRVQARTYPEGAERLDERVRENLPSEPKRGDTHRDVRVHGRLGARLADEDPAEGSDHGD
jgi:hypothetical protein